MSFCLLLFVLQFLYQLLLHGMSSAKNQWSKQMFVEWRWEEETIRKQL
uniref:Uncharacterized protein n=1 Tax=Arundo donax TaxID=35708 RepID=A0A0A9EK69_ARUDO